MSIFGMLFYTLYGLIGVLLAIAGPVVMVVVMAVIATMAWCFLQWKKENKH